MADQREANEVATFVVRPFRVQEQVCIDHLWRAARGDDDVGTEGLLEGGELMPSEGGRLMPSRTSHVFSKARKFAGFFAIMSSKLFPGVPSESRRFWGFCGGSATPKAVSDTPSIHLRIKNSYRKESGST